MSGEAVVCVLGPRGARAGLPPPYFCTVTRHVLYTMCTFSTMKDPHTCNQSRPCAALSLMEVVIAIVIIGILALVASAIYRAAVGRSDDLASEVTLAGVDREFRALEAFSGAGVPVADMTSIPGIDFSVSDSDGDGLLLPGDVVTYKGISLTLGFGIDPTAPGDGGSGAQVMRNAAPPSESFLALSAGGPSDDSIFAVATLPDDSFVLAGRFQGSILFGDSGLALNSSLGREEAFVVKVDNTGSFSWATSSSSGPTGGSVALDVTIAEDGSAFVAGYFSGTATFGTTTLVSNGGEDGFLAKIDAHGNFTWATSFGGRSDDRVTSVAAVGDGTLVAAGYFSGSVNFGAITREASGPADIFVTKVDTEGGIIWASSGGGTSTEKVNSVTTLADGAAIVAGEFQANTSLGQTGNLVSAGGPADSDAFVAKVDRDGNFVWSTRLGGDGFDAVNEVASLPSGASIVTGPFRSQDSPASFGPHLLSSAGASDIFVARIAANGSVTWASRAGSADIIGDAATGVTAFSDGSSVVTGFFRGRSDFGSWSLFAYRPFDSFVARVDASGSFVSVAHIDGASLAGASQDVTTSIDSFSDGAVLVGGNFLRSELSFGDITLRAPRQNSWDIFAVRVAGNGTFTAG